MARKTIKKNFSEQIEIGEGDRLTIKKGVVGHVANVGITELSSTDTPEGLDRARIRVDGKIIVSKEGPISSAIWSNSDVDDVTITIGKTGVLKAGLFGIHHGGPGLVLDNAGLIQANVGIGGEVKAPEIINSGRILGVAAAIDWSKSIGGELDNSGLIRASQGPAVTIQGYLAPSDYGIRNSGTIATMVDGGDAIYVDGNDRVSVVNTGTIRGNVMLGFGEAEFENRGTVTGTVFGSAGDTVFRLFAETTIDDYGGNDKVYSTVSVTLNGGIEELVLQGRKDIDATGDTGDNKITGNSGDNIIQGLSGKDVLEGGMGDDSLTGGDHADTFIYATGYDHDVIEDADASDTIDLSGVDAATSLDALLAIAVDKDGDIVLDFGSGDTLTFSDITLETFSGLGFVFQGAVAG